jgi:hypothetical protein
MNGRENGGTRFLEKPREEGMQEISKERGQQATRRQETYLRLPWDRLWSLQ